MKCTSLQFPLTVAYACFIHKCQGMTLEKVRKIIIFHNQDIFIVRFTTTHFTLQVVVDIGDNEFSLELAHVHTLAYLESNTTRYAH